jgi:hypothetical protein
MAMKFRLFNVLAVAILFCFSGCQQKQDSPVDCQKYVDTWYKKESSALRAKLAKHLADVDNLNSSRKDVPSVEQIMKEADEEVAVEREIRGEISRVEQLYPIKIKACGPTSSAT